MRCLKGEFRVRAVEKIAACPQLLLRLVAVIALTPGSKRDDVDSRIADAAEQWVLVDLRPYAAVEIPAGAFHFLLGFIQCTQFKSAPGEDFGNSSVGFIKKRGGTCKPDLCG